MNIDPRELHRFTPSRPDGVVCVTVRNPDALGAVREICGYPAGHPIHAEPPNGDTPQDRGPYQDLRVLRGIIAACVDAESVTREIAFAALDRLGAAILALPDPAPSLAELRDADAARPAVRHALAAGVSVPTRYWMHPCGTARIAREVRPADDDCNCGQPGEWARLLRSSR